MCSDPNDKSISSILAYLKIKLAEVGWPVGPGNGDYSRDLSVVSVSWQEMAHTFHMHLEGMKSDF